MYGGGDIVDRSGCGVTRCRMGGGYIVGRGGGDIVDRDGVGMTIC